MTAPSALTMTQLDIAVVIVTYECAALPIDSRRSVAAERSATGFHLLTVVVDNASGDAPSIAERIASNGWRSWVTLVAAAKSGGFATWYVPESRVMHIRGQSTTVPDETKGPRRLSSYWFESRRRYFAMTYGIGHVFSIDIVSFLACSIGLVKCAALGQMYTATPHYLLRHSGIWPRNRKFPALRC